MIKVASNEANNPVKLNFLKFFLKLHLIFLFKFFNFAKKLNLKNSQSSVKLPLPGKLVIPNPNKGNLSILGLGDIVMPGLLLCFVLRFDAYKRKELTTDLSQDIVQTAKLKNSKITYFHCSLIGYLIGLITATLCTEVFKLAQPALLYLVPFTLLPLLIMAYLKGDLKHMWNEPFTYSSPKYYSV